MYPTPLNPPELPPVILIVAIPAETVTVEIPAPRKSSIVAPVPTEPPAVLIPTPLITPVRFAPLPTKDVAVTTPEELRLVAAIVPTVILGVPDKPKEVVAKEAVDAVPVRAPIKEVAVTIPAKLAPVLTFPTSCTLVTDILFLFSYLY